MFFGGWTPLNRAKIINLIRSLYSFWTLVALFGLLKWLAEGFISHRLRRQLSSMMCIHLQRLINGAATWPNPTWVSASLLRNSEGLELWDLPSRPKLYGVKSSLCRWHSFLLLFQKDGAQHNVRLLFGEHCLLGIDYSHAWEGYFGCLIFFEDRLANSLLNALNQLLTALGLSSICRLSDGSGAFSDVSCVWLYGLHVGLRFESCHRIRGLVVASVAKSGWGCHR